MKKGLFVLAFLATGFSFAKELNVSVKQSGEKVEISFVTTKTHSSMCFITVTDADLSYGRLLGSEVVENGKIELKASSLPGSICLTAFGPHRGQTVFTKGNSLPSLKNGSYSLRINGQSYGILKVSADSVSLFE